MNFFSKNRNLSIDRKLLLNLQKQNNVQFLSRIQTLEEVANNNNKSLVRYGDGECSIMFEDNSLYFQEFNAHLKTKLIKILTNPQPNVLVTFNLDFLSRENYPVVLNYERGEKTYDKYLKIKTEKDVGILFRKENKKKYKEYFEKFVNLYKSNFLGEATLFFLGFYFEEYKNNNLEYVLELYKKIFTDKNILVIASKNPVHGQSFKDIFDKKIISSHKGVDFIYSPSENAFAEYENILKEVDKKVSKSDLVLIQAGPTGTALAYEIHSKYNKQCLDVGSFNISLTKANSINHFEF